MWTHVSQACSFAREGGKVQGADPGRGWGQVKIELALGRSSRARRQEVQGGDARGRRDRDGVEMGWGCLSTQLNRSVWWWEHAISTRLNPPAAASAVDFVSGPQFTDLQNGSLNKPLDNTSRGLPRIHSLKVTPFQHCLGNRWKGIKGTCLRTKCAMLRRGLKGHLFLC